MKAYLNENIKLTINILWRYNKFHINDSAVFKAKMTSLNDTTTLIVKRVGFTLFKINYQIIPTNYIIKNTRFHANHLFVSLFRRQTVLQTFSSILSQSFYYYNMLWAIFNNLTPSWLNKIALRNTLIYSNRRMTFKNQRHNKPADTLTNWDNH